jgi:hypothetical protein
MIRNIRGMIFTMTAHSDDEQPGRWNKFAA